MQDLILKEMNEYGADGVDFVPLAQTFQSPMYDKEVYLSLTREELLTYKGCYPRSGRVYWKMVNGQKIYIDKNQKEYKYDEEDCSCLYVERTLNLNLSRL